MAVIIRSYQSSDLSACQKLMLDVGHSEQYLNHCMQTDMANIEKNYLEIPNAHWWVAVLKDDDRIVGEVAVQPLYLSDPACYQNMAVDERDQICELRRMAVAPDVQRLGVGSLLLSTLLDFVRQHGYHQVHLATSIYMHKACAFYQKHGFVKGRIARYSLAEVKRALQSQERFINEHNASAVFESDVVIPKEDQQRMSLPPTESGYMYRQHFSLKLML